MALLAFGTVQLGEAYGRHPHLPSEAEATALLLEAARTGVASVDTAFNYGASEARVGVALGALGSEPPRWEVVTKVDEVELESAAQLIAAVDASVALSQQRLGLEVLDCCCIHNYEMWMAHDSAAWKRLCYHRDVVRTHATLLLAITP